MLDLNNAGVNSGTLPTGFGTPRGRDSESPIKGHIVLSCSVWEKQLQNRLCRAIGVPLCTWAVISLLCEKLVVSGPAF